MVGMGMAGVLSPSSRVESVETDSWTDEVMSREVELSSQAEAAEFAAWRILAVTLLSSGM
jgi:hypothetical protein